MTLSLDRINRARESGYEDDQIVEAISKRDPDFGQKVQRAKESGHNSTAILQSIEKKLNTPVNTPAPQQNTPAQPTSSPEIPDNSNINQAPENPKKDKAFWNWVMQEPGEDQIGRAHV